MSGPIYTAADDEIYISRLTEVAPTEVRLSINPLSHNKVVYMTPDIAEAVAERLIRLAREAREHARQKE